MGPPTLLLQSYSDDADSGSVLQEEKQEKAFRLAEMEATKAGNIIEHEAEIYARPKREWFVTSTQKKASAQAAAKEERSAGPTAQENKKKERHKGFKGVTADIYQSCREKCCARDSEIRHQFVFVAGEGQTKDTREHKHVTGTREVMGSVKAAKSAARGFRESGLKPKEAAKAALTATGASKREKQKPKRKRPDTESDDSPGFKPPRISHVYAGAVLIAKLGFIGHSTSALVDCDVLRSRRQMFWIIVSF